MAEELRLKGNAAFSSGKFAEAVELYTKALALDANAAALWSNRAAAYMSLKKFEQALLDATKAVQVNPSFSKVRFTSPPSCPRPLSHHSIL